LHSKGKMMFNRRVLNCAALIISTLMLSACGPGGGNSSDVFPRETQPTTAITGPNSFLLFPNPQMQADGTLQTNTAAYTTAYYEAIDPNNDKDTLAKWKAANGFGSGTGTEVSVVFGDVRDLGYGRRMTARTSVTDLTLPATAAVMVENYLVSPVVSYDYNSLNVEAAVVQDKRWHVGTNGIEYSGSTCTASETALGCDPTIKFAKFYTFDPVTGQRLLEAQLDGRGKKAMPGICISCHGGRGDPLTPSSGSPTGKQLFPMVRNSASMKRGDVQAHMNPLVVDSFDFSTRSGYTRAEQEAALKTINNMILCSYPITAAAGGVDACRRTYNFLEWAGTAANIIKGAYNAPGTAITTTTLPNATFSDAYVPAGWSGVGQTSLYQNVLAHSCRTCHIQRGNAGNDELNFDTYCNQGVPGTCDAGTYFYGYADQIKHHVIDRGNMPLAKIVYESLWGTSKIESLATFLGTAQSESVRDSSGAVLKPGRPIAIPGPNRTTTSPATLSAAGSLYATSYNWSIVSSVGAAPTLSSATAVSPTLTTTGNANGTSVIRLVVSDGTTQSASSDITMTIDSTMGVGGKLPANPTFVDIKAVLQGPASCSGCHTSGGGPPIFYTNSDRNGDGNPQTTHGQTDDIWFYTELRGRINFTNIAASPLLRKPTGHHHGGGLVLDTTSGTACATCGAAYSTYGAYYAAAYNMFVNWIINGAPY
jgi:mono/diheme cytochrome c family protein